MSARFRRSRLWLSALAIAVGCGAGPVHAQDNPFPLSDEQIGKIVERIWGDRNKDADNADVFTFDYDVPTSPAITLLGVDKINQSNSLKPFILSVPNVLDSKEAGQAIALDFSPAWLIEQPGERTFANYRGNKPLWFRTRIGVAVYEGVGDPDPAKQRPSRLSVGLSTSLFNSSDPLLARAPGVPESAWGTCVDGGYDAIRQSMPRPDDTAELAEARGKLNAAFDAWEALPPGPAKDEAKAKHDRLEGEFGALRKNWAEKAAETFAKSKGGKILAGCLRVADRAAKTGLDLDLGGGAVWEGNPGKISGFARPSAAFWSSLRVPLSVGRPKAADSESLIQWADDLKSWFMIGGSGRLGLAEAVATGDAAKPKISADTFTGWLGIERNTDTNRFTAQVGLRRTSPRAAVDSAFAGTQTVYLLGLDQKLTDSMWLTATYGRAQGSGVLKSDSVVKVGVTLDTPALRRILGD